MTQEEILTMEPGRELNIEVAKEVMEHVVASDGMLGYLERLIDPGDGGSVWSSLQPYSEDISVAELVVDKMIERGYDDAIYWADFGDGVYTEAEAICKAALLAILEEHRIEEVSSEILKQALGD